MIELDDLEPLFDEMPIEPSAEIKDQLFAIFKTDFIDNPLLVRGQCVKIISHHSNMPGFRQYPETFVHVITRKSKLSGKRSFDRERANRIHWIKNILLQSTDPRIKFFKFKDEQNILKDHYWFEDLDFMIVLKPVSPETMLISAFCVDNDDRRIFRGRYKDYRSSL